jgi:hypothetical protein
MHDILKLSEEERRTVFRNTAQKMGVHESIVGNHCTGRIAVQRMF